MLMVVSMEMITTRFAIVTDLFVVVTGGEPGLVAGTQLGTVFQRVGRVVTEVGVVVKEIVGLQVAAVVGEFGLWFVIIIASSCSKSYYYY
jgi:hypothetical protein